MEQFEHINHDAGIMGGKACIAGTRITVGMILMQISEGSSIRDLLTQYPLLTEDAIAQAMRYAAWAVGSREDLVIPA